MTPDKLAAGLTARLHGPHADEHTASAARLAAEAIRYLNYATRMPADGLTSPATVAVIAGDLAAAAGRLPQVCGQLADWLDAEQAAGRLGDDRGGPGAIAAGVARTHLDHAAVFARHLAEALADAQTVASHLYAAGDDGR